MSATSGFRSIMVPLDGSRFAEAAIPFAIAIAERGHSKVRFVLVHPDDHPPLKIEFARVYLDKLTRQFRERLGHSLSSIILTAPVAPSLVKHAQEIGADLVVMTTHGWGGLRRAWLGSVADQLIRNLEIPVLVIRPNEDGSPHCRDLSEILVPLDGSPLSEVALHPAAALARLWNAEISLLQVVHPTTEVAEDEEFTAICRESAQAYLREVVDRLRLTGVKVSGVVVEGGTVGVAGTLLERAKPERTSLIAMATQGRGGFRRMVLGSITNKMIRTADVPVLVVPMSRTARQIAKAQREILALGMTQAADA